MELTYLIIANLNVNIRLNYPDRFFDKYIVNNLQGSFILYKHTGTVFSKQYQYVYSAHYFLNRLKPFAKFISTF